MPTPLTAAAVVNQAIQLVGGFNNDGPVTGSPPNFVGGAAAQAANVIYEECVKLVGRKFGWDFSRNVATLINTGNTPPLGWVYEYIYPTSGIQVRQVLPANSLITALDPRPFRWDIGNAVGGSVQATGRVNFTGNPSIGDTVTLNGRVFTFASSSGSYQIVIGGNTAGTVANFLNALQNNATYLADSALNVATYTPDFNDATNYMAITYKTPGEDGNAYTLAETSSVINVSGAHLTGGVTSLQKVIWTDLANAQAVISGQPPESAWDAMFAESVVQAIASKLNLALASKPDSSKLAAEQSMAIEQAGEGRTDT